jgi:hypothetical protein
VCARTPKATTPSLYTLFLFPHFSLFTAHLSPPSLITTKLLLLLFSPTIANRIYRSALSLPPPRSLATSSPFSSRSFALSCVGPAPWGSRRSSSRRRFSRCCCGEMVRRTTRCCDTEQVGCPGLSFSLLRSVGRSSWAVGVVLACLFWPARERGVAESP